MFAGSLPNSHRNPEPELMRILMTYAETDLLADWLIRSDKSRKTKYKQKDNDDQDPFGEALQVLASKRNVGSLAATDGFETYDLWQFLRLSRNITEAGTVGNEWFPGELLGPCRTDVTLPDNHFSCLLRYYNAAYEETTFVDDLDQGPPNAIEISPIITQYARLRISGEIFGSNISSRYSGNAHILAKWANGEANDAVDTYPGQVQYFFKHTFYQLNGQQVTHYLAFVRWYRSVPSKRVYFSLGGSTPMSSDVELWQHDFLPEGRDSILPVHLLLGRFVPSSYRCKNKSYLAISPLNRRYHL